MNDEEWQCITNQKTRKGVVDNQQKILKQQQDTIKNKNSYNNSFGRRGWSKPSIPRTNTTKILVDTEATKNENHTLSQFHDKCNQPLTNLLADYGEQDPDYEKFKVADTEEDTIRSNARSMLSSRDKAPIRIKLLSFGFTYNAPKQSREGLGYSNPIPVIDCRDFLPCIPPYLERSNGLSFQVKRSILQSCNHDDNSRIIGQEEEDDGTTTNHDNHSSADANINEKNPNILRKKVNTSSAIIFQSLHDAISTGGHGYALPLEMTIYIGSECGCHRSVVYAELLGQSLRATLRSNKDGKITQPVSVETMHRDIDKRRIFLKNKYDEDPNDRKRNYRMDPSLEDW